MGRYRVKRYRINKKIVQYALSSYFCIAHCVSYGMQLGAESIAATLDPASLLMLEMAQESGAAENMPDWNAVKAFLGVSFRDRLEGIYSPEVLQSSPYRLATSSS